MGPPTHHPPTALCDARGRYFHNWSGNRVTVRDWFQLSLKEGLTNFRQQGFEEDMTSYAATSLQAAGRQDCEARTLRGRRSVTAAHAQFEAVASTGA